MLLRSIVDTGPIHHSASWQLWPRQLEHPPTSQRSVARCERRYHYDSELLLPVLEKPVIYEETGSQGLYVLLRG